MDSKLKVGVLVEVVQEAVADTLLLQSIAPPGWELELVGERVEVGKPLDDAVASTLEVLGEVGEAAEPSGSVAMARDRVSD